MVYENITKLNESIESDTFTYLNTSMSIILALSYRLIPNVVLILSLTPFDSNSLTQSSSDNLSGSDIIPSKTAVCQCF